jgi:hypothetical protein
MFSHIKEHKKYQYVFVKVQFLKTGQNTSGTPHWHLDSSLNPDDYYENYIFTTGLHNNTEFFQTPIQINPVETSLQFHRQIEKVYRDKDSYYTKPLTIYKYNGSNVHRGRRVTIEEPRILIRMSNTDKKLTNYPEGIK